MRHPLLRGANAGSGISIETGLDSSPPARGKLSIICGIDYAPRFIPSNEGQTSSFFIFLFSSMIHHLRRGADMDRREPLQEQIDSSPPARGRPKIAPRYRGLVSIHPLLRGADITKSMSSIVKVDSSPPARGRLPSVPYNLCSARFIPSCEGQTISEELFTRLYAIHPLLRGADRPQSFLSWLIADSSPPARGRPYGLQNRAVFV